MIITPYNKNAKKHTQKQIEKIANSIKEFGMNQPIVVDKKGVIIIGHGRYEALKHLGWDIKDEYVKVIDLTENEAKAYRIADNKLNESEWDMSIVYEELKSLPEVMVDLSGWEDLELDYKPNYEPDFQNVPKTEDLIEKGQEKLDNQFKKGIDYITVICPKCYHEFNITGE